MNLCRTRGAVKPKVYYAMVHLDELRYFKDASYTRNLIVRSDNVEILLVCWKPGQSSPVHDHGPSDGVMVILEGEMTNTSYTPDGKKVTTVWGPGTVGHTPVGVRHEVVNHSDRPVVSLHVYAPPLERNLQKDDLGAVYDNEVREVALPEEITRFMLGKIHADGKPFDPVL